MEDENIFPQDIRLQTDTVLMQDGSIHVYPVQGEATDPLDPVSQRGRCVTNPNGETHFYPYAKVKKRSTNVYCTAHAIVTKTKSSFVVRFLFPRKMEKSKITNALIEEGRTIGFEILLSNILDKHEDPSDNG